MIWIRDPDIYKWIESSFNNMVQWTWKDSSRDVQPFSPWLIYAPPSHQKQTNIVKAKQFIAHLYHSCMSQRYRCSTKTLLSRCLWLCEYLSGFYCGNVVQFHFYLVFHSYPRWDQETVPFSVIVFLSVLSVFLSLWEFIIPGRTWNCSRVFMQECS